MKDVILKKASDLFLTLGFKSVTMDDIAQHLGISKKTIYQHFNNKAQLVKETSLFVFDLISKDVDCICALEKNPIEELYDIKHFVMEHLKHEKSSPQYQLQKYYPQIYSTLKQKQYELIKTCVTQNLKRGIQLNLFRETIDVEFISRMYFNSIISIKDKDLFPLKQFSMNMLMEHYLEYHLRGICTLNGLKKLEEFTNKTLIKS